MKFWVFGALFLALFGCGKRVELPQQPETRPAGTPITDSTNVSGTDLIYTGFDRDQICQLIVHRQWYENNENLASNYRVEVSTSYAHDGSSIGKQVLTFSNEDKNILLWENKKTGEYLKLTVLNTDAPMRDPDSFTLRWLHHKHHHKNTCKDLRPR